MRLKAAPRPRGLALALGFMTAAATLLAARAPAPAATADRRRVDARTGLLEVPIDELIAAMRRKDRAESGRIAERIGVARLGQALRRNDGASVLAALAGITALPGGVRLLGPVTELMVSADPPYAVAAAHALGDLLAPASPADLDTWEVPPDVVEATCAALRTSAIGDVNATTVRLAAMDALADAAGICAPTPELIALLHDPTPAIRRAASLVLRPRQRLQTGGFASGTRDVDQLVAAASVAALCEGLALPGVGPHGGPKEPSWDQTKDAARRLVAVRETPPEDAVQMLDCLDPSSKNDRQLLESLRARYRTPVGDRAAEILNVAQTPNRARP